MRNAIVSGKFYPAKAEELKKQIDKFFSSLDVASVKIKGDREIKAAIVPHAGYFYSGKCASFVYNLLKKEKVDTFIILGTNHSGLGEKVCFSVDDFETSLGRVETDIEFIEDLLIKGKKTNFNGGVDENAHRYEHSIEVQLPFLQSVQKKFKIVPVLIRDLTIIELKSLGKLISDLVKEHEKKGKRIFVLASSDFTHYGPSYNFVPFSGNVKENLYALDEKAINSILRLDSDEFYVISSQKEVQEDHKGISGSQRHQGRDKIRNVYNIGTVFEIINFMAKCFSVMLKH
jgi:AmmeMemoRadiSam system protein B